MKHSVFATDRSQQFTNPTNTNVVIDAPRTDLRRARSAMLSLQPTTTGSATAIGLIFPELVGKLSGHAVRVPVLNASFTDWCKQLNCGTDPGRGQQSVSGSCGRLLAGILGFEHRPPGFRCWVDFARDSRSSVVDGPSTMVTTGTPLKVYACSMTTSLGIRVVWSIWRKSL